MCSEQFKVLDPTSQKNNKFHSHRDANMTRKLVPGSRLLWPRINRVQYVHRQRRLFTDVAQDAR